MKMDILQILIIIFTTFISSIILTPVVKKIAFNVGSVDAPNGVRRINRVAMPTMGGLIIFLSFLVGYIFFGDKNPEMIPILIGGIIIILTGIFDGIKSMPPLTKFIGQFCAALILTLYGGMVITELSAFGMLINFGVFSYPITILFILGMINAMNLIDGLDGLASGISSIFFITIGIIALILNKAGGLDILLALIMIGSTLGFLVNNFYPAKIYLGDSGSMFLGYVISVIAILGFKNVTLTSFIVPVIIMGVPIFDTACAIFRRIINKKSIVSADDKHLHHQILKLNLGHRNTVLIIYAIDLLFAFASIFYILQNRIWGMILYATIFIVVIIIVSKTSIIFDKSKKDIKK